MIRTVLALLFASALAASAAADEPAIAISNAWARAMPEGAKAGAAYVTITNNGTGADRLLGVSTPVAGEAQLHTTINDNGVMKMRPIESIELKPGASVTLKPGGMHLMLMGLKQPLKEGESFPLALNFEKAGRLETAVTVTKAGAMGNMSTMGNMQGMDMK